MAMVRSEAQISVARCWTPLGVPRGSERSKNIRSIFLQTQSSLLKSRKSIETDTGFRLGDAVG